MRIARHFTSTLALAVLGTSLAAIGPAARGQQGMQHPMDQANPGQTNQGTRSTAATIPDSTMAKSADKTFAMKAAAGGMAEVKLGKLAQQNASSDAVKQFGMRMEKDHSAAGMKLKTVASQNNLTLPSGMDAKDQATYDQLAKLHGAAFDRAYMKDMVDDHEQDVSEFKREASAGKNHGLKNFASETLPTLEDHLKMARDVASKVTGGSSGTAKGAE